MSIHFSSPYIWKQNVYDGQAEHLPKHLYIHIDDVVI